MIFGKKQFHFKIFAARTFKNLIYFTVAVWGKVKPEPKENSEANFSLFQHI